MLHICGERKASETSMERNQVVEVDIRACGGMGHVLNLVANWSVFSQVKEYTQASPAGAGDVIASRSGMLVRQVCRESGATGDLPPSNQTSTCLTKAFHKSLTPHGVGLCLCYGSKVVRRDRWEGLTEY